MGAVRRAQGVQATPDVQPGLGTFHCHPRHDGQRHASGNRHIAAQLVAVQRGRTDNRQASGAGTPFHIDPIGRVASEGVGGIQKDGQAAHGGTNRILAIVLESRGRDRDAALVVGNQSVRIVRHRTLGDGQIAEPPT